MDGTAPHPKIATVFGKIATQPAKHFVVSAADADGIVDKRLRLLSLYTQPGTPNDLKEKFQNAIKGTSACHRMAQAFGVLEHQIKPMIATPDSGLLISARVHFDSARPQGSGGARAQELTGLRDDVLRILVAAARNPHPSATLVEVIQNGLPSLSPFDLSFCLTEAALLMHQMQSWRTALEVLGTMLSAGRLYDGILYEGLIRSLGSRLERDASRNQFKADAAGIPVEVLGHAPVVGSVVGTVDLLTKFARDIWDKEGVLENTVADQNRKHLMANDFVDTYSTALLIWANLASPLQMQTAQMARDLERQWAGQADLRKPADIDGAVTNSLQPPPDMAGSQI